MAIIQSGNEASVATNRDKLVRIRISVATKKAGAKPHRPSLLSLFTQSQYIRGQLRTVIRPALKIPEMTCYTLRHFVATNAAPQLPSRESRDRSG